MPRKKVDPMNRRRALQACVPCKQSKKRCDSRIPCLHCLKRGNGGACIYSADRPRIPGRPATSQTPEAPSGEAREACKRASVTPAAAAGGHTANMLKTSKGDHVYVGDAASLSFFNLLRDMLTRYMGPSAFTTNNRKTYMLETQREHLHVAERQCHHSEHELVVLVDSYYTASSGILDVLKKRQVLDFLHMHPQIQSSNPRLHDAVVHAMLAIGAQCRAGELQDRQCEQYHLAKTQTVAFDSMLEDPSLDLARVFLLLSFYMFGASRRNAAFMYIGVAARAAYALGLHHGESYRCISSHEQTTRLKTWKSVRIMDLLVGAVLGRPPATADMGTTALAEQDLDSNQDLHRRVALDATYEVWSIVDIIVHQFYRQGQVDLSSAKTFLATLENWSESLSPLLRSTSPLDAGVARQDVAIGNMHVACSYYYAVMMATRKFLVSHLTSKLLNHADHDGGGGGGGGNNDDDDDRDADAAAAANPDEAMLARTCIESAMLTCQTCKEVLDAGMLLPNMCFLTAWLFWAAIIIGFDLFTQDHLKADLDEALLASTAVLDQLAQANAQALHYYEILTSLLSAIREHHQRKAMHRPAARKSLVTKIFSIQGDASGGSSSGSSQGLMETTKPPPGPPALAHTESFPLDDLGGATITTTTATTTTGIEFDNIDSVAVQLWDEFLLGQDMSFSLDAGLE